MTHERSEKSIRKQCIELKDLLERTAFPVSVQVCVYSVTYLTSLTPQNKSQQQKSLLEIVCYLKHMFVWSSSKSLQV